MKDRDTKWSQFNKELIKLAIAGQWGLYRCMRLDMAQFLYKEGKLHNALETFLEVFYLDINGPNNAPHIDGLPSPENEFFIPWDSKLGFVAPGLIYEIKKLSGKLDMTQEDIKTVFIKHNQFLKNSLKIPMDVFSAWGILEEELK